MISKKKWKKKLIFSIFQIFLWADQSNLQNQENHHFFREFRSFGHLRFGIWHCQRVLLMKIVSTITKSTHMWKALAKNDFGDLWSRKSVGGTWPNQCSQWKLAGLNPENHQNVRTFRSFGGLRLDIRCYQCVLSMKIVSTITKSTHKWKALAKNDFGGLWSRKSAGGPAKSLSLNLFYEFSKKSKNPKKLRKNIFSKIARIALKICTQSKL